MAGESTLFGGVQVSGDEAIHCYGYDVTGLTEVRVESVTEDGIVVPLPATDGKSTIRSRCGRWFGEVNLFGRHGRRFIEWMALASWDGDADLRSTMYTIDARTRSSEKVEVRC